MTSNEASEIYHNRDSQTDVALEIEIELQFEAGCLYCTHPWEEHTSGVNGPCTSTYACRCLAFDYPGKPFTRNLSNKTRLIDGYFA